MHNNIYVLWISASKQVTDTSSISWLFHSDLKKVKSEESRWSYYNVTFPVTNYGLPLWDAMSATWFIVGHMLNQAQFPNGFSSIVDEMHC